MKTTEDGHFIDDPMDIVNAKPNFDGLGMLDWEFDMKQLEFCNRLQKLIDIYVNSHFYTDITLSFREFPNKKGETFNMNFEFKKNKK